MNDTVFINGVWYEVETTVCKTYVIFRDRDGREVKFYNDAEDAPAMAAFVAG